MFAQLTQFWSRLSPSLKVIYAGVAAAVLAVVSGVGYWSSQSDYAVLCSNLPTDEAAVIVQKLDTDRVAYKLTANGTTIKVPIEKVQNVRMSLAVAGLTPGAGKGYELFDTMSMGATPFVQQMNYIRAIQGELQRTIMTMEPVASARVHIALPDSTPFVRDQQPATASVTIKTKPGATLDRKATAGIVAFVASSVKGLSRENVTVLDSDSHVLSEKQDAHSGMASSDQLSYQRDVESHLAQNAQEILSQLLGPGRALVRVTAEMSFRHLTEASKVFDPKGKVIKRESVTSSKSTSTVPRGLTGAVPNTVPSTANSGSAAGPNKNDETIESEYVNSVVDKTQEEKQGKIERLTVAVMLIPPEKAGDVPLEESLGITKEDAESLVKQAIGFKDDRGDKIQVSIGRGPVEAAVEALAVNDNAVAALPLERDYMRVVQRSSLGIAGLVVVAIAFRFMRRPNAAKNPSTQPAFASANTAEELADLHAVAATIKAWLEETPTIRFDRSTPPSPEARTA